MVTFPVYDNSSGAFFKLEGMSDFFANNYRGYSIMNTEDLLYCERYPEITLCSKSTDSVWFRKSDRSCESSIFYNETSRIQKLCSFEELHYPIGRSPKPVKISPGLFHYALNGTQSVSISCRETEDIKRINGM